MMLTSEPPEQLMRDFHRSEGPPDVLLILFLRDEQDAVFLRDGVVRSPALDAMLGKEIDVLLLSQQTEKYLLIARDGVMPGERLVPTSGRRSVAEFVKNWSEAPENTRRVFGEDVATIVAADHLASQAGYAAYFGVPQDVFPFALRTIRQMPNYEKIFFESFSLRALETLIGAIVRLIQRLRQSRPAINVISLKKILDEKHDLAAQIEGSLNRIDKTGDTLAARCGL